MLMSAAFPTKYLSAADLQGREVTVTISHVAMEDVDKGEIKPIVYFQGKGKGLVLNKTNASMIAMIFGDETDAWPGAALVLYAIDTEYQGKPVRGLRVKAAAQSPQPQQPAPRVEDPAAGLDDDIPF